MVPASTRARTKARPCPGAVPVRRSIYERFTPWLTDKANPFEFASATPIKGWRDAIGPLMGAFAIDTSRELRQAWNALNRDRLRPSLRTYDLSVLSLPSLY